MKAIASSPNSDTASPKAAVRMMPRVPGQTRPPRLRARRRKSRQTPVMIAPMTTIRSTRNRPPTII